MQSFLPDIDSLTLTQQVAQMVTVRTSGYLFDHQIQYPIWEANAATLRYLLEDLGVGGVILLGGSAGEIALRTQQLQDQAKIPLLISADIEEGVGQRFSGATWFPPPMALNAIAQTNLSVACDYAEKMGAVTAQEARAIGINWVLAPIVDVNNNPDNPVINVRAFGETTEIVSKLATAFIRGAQSYRVLTTAKHFPGHGDTAIDSHLELPVLSHDRARLERVELPPFQAAIQAGVDAVMSAHLQIPALDDRYPATLSPKVLTEELRQRLNFQGLIVTDALVMGAIANRYGVEESAVLAVEAGADVLLMPLDAEKAIHAVCAAVTANRIAPERIRASVERIWRAKLKVCSPSETPSLMSQLAEPSAIATNTEILQASMRVHHPTPSRLDRLPDTGRNLILIDDGIDCDFLGRTAPAIAAPSQFGFTHVEVIDRYTPTLSLDSNLTSSYPTLLQLFIRGNPFRGSAGLTETAQSWFEFLLKSQQLQALIIYGSPYVLEQFLPLLPSEVPYVFSYGQMQLAQEIAIAALFAQKK
ncbi:MAG: beta-glucosidase [Candidatus Parcubacteria bacterium]|nr:beta-glucosidase [Leptolyngbyaceae cyanobacterium LF-bin-113]